MVLPVELVVVIVMGILAVTAAKILNLQQDARVDPRSERCNG